MATQRASEMQTGHDDAEGTTTGQGGSVAAPPGVAVQAHALSAPAPHDHQAQSTCTWAPAALHAAAMLLAIGALVPEAVFLNQRSWYNDYDYVQPKGWGIATAPGLALATSVIALVLAAALLAGRRLACSTDRASAAPACSPFLVAALVASLEAAMLALWIASVAAGAQTADKVHRHGSHRVWTRCNALMLVFASASALTWGTALVCSLRALVRALVPGCGGGDAMYEPLLDAEAGFRAGSPTGSDNSTTPRFVVATRGGDQPPTPPLQPARLALHAAAALLAIGVMAAQGVLIGHYARVYGSRMQGVIVADKPALVMATSAVTTALAAALLVLHCLPGARRLWAAAVAAAPGLAFGGAAMELLLSCTLMSLWAACVATSVRTLQRLHDGWASPVWIGSNSAALALECVCVIVWAVAVAVTAAAFVRQAWPWWARRVAIARAAGTCVSREVRLLLLVMGSLLAVGVLAAQATFMNRFLYDPYMRGSRVAVAPALVIVTASAALVTAVVVLAGPGARSLLGGIESAVQAQRAEAAEALAAACVLCLWVASLGVSAKTADVLRKYDRVAEWSRCNTAALVLECVSVLVWGAVVALAVEPVGRAVGALASQWTAARGGAYQRLAESEQAADAGKFADKPRTETSSLAPATTSTIAIRRAAPRALAQAGPLGLYFLGLLLAIGVLVAQCFLIHHRAWLYDYSSNYEISGKALATGPALVIATAAATIAVAAIGLVWSCVLALWPAAHAAVAGASGMPLCVAIVEADVAGVIWALWVVSMGASASTAHTLRKRPYNQSSPWTRSNAAVLAMACISVLVWGAALALTAGRVVRKVCGGQPQPAAADVEDQSVAVESAPLLAADDAAP